MTDIQTLLARLTELHLRCDPSEPWRVEQEPHNYPDGTTHFNHVVCTSYIGGRPATVMIGRHLTPELGELLVLARNHLPELIALARKAIGDEPTVPSPIAQVRDFIERKYPDGRVVLTPPLHVHGVWHLDIRLGPEQPLLVVQWSAISQFMVTRTSAEKGYGEGADEVIQTIEETTAWVAQQA